LKARFGVAGNMHIASMNLMRWCAWEIYERYE
jgi:hypothetical protein